MSRIEQQEHEQQQLMEFEGFAVLEQLALIQDEIEQSQQIRAVKQLEEEERLQQVELTDQWDQERLYQFERISTSSPPLDDSISSQNDK
ncbi:unnamed protein product [Rotaria magnacalcarata]|nr:unnamed protein product [Rotaria magnacalcarata]CAF2035730.1 unnamed protein product [Rotaria magnacalcarata]CAF3790605.1 unnamed protein product [Rotaria magnacalcarata]CAF3815376.1 unnamed protein product [Rotaria magnacalcarata]CAF3821592.1 unnamed protein product [Rotaria magnacalcarata]